MVYPCYRDRIANGINAKAVRRRLASFWNNDDNNRTPVENGDVPDWDGKPFTERLAFWRSIYGRRLSASWLANEEFTSPCKIIGEALKKLPDTVLDDACSRSPDADVTTHCATLPLIPRWWDTKKCSSPGPPFILRQKTTEFATTFPHESHSMPHSVDDSICE